MSEERNMFDHAPDCRSWMEHGINTCTCGVEPTPTPARSEARPTHAEIIDALGPMTGGGSTPIEQVEQATREHDAARPEAAGGEGVALRIRAEQAEKERQYWIAQCREKEQQLLVEQGRVVTLEMVARAKGEANESLRQQLAAALASHAREGDRDGTWRVTISALEGIYAEIASLKAQLAAAREDGERWRERLRALLGSCIEVHADGCKRWVYGASTITDADLAGAVGEIDAARAEAGRETEGGR